MAVYTVLIGRGNQGAPGSSVVFTVPTGRVYVITSITLTAYAGAGTVEVAIPAVANLDLLKASAADVLTQTTYGRWALVAGDVVTFVGTGVGGQWYISGYSLS